MLGTTFGFFRWGIPSPPCPWWAPAAPLSDGRCGCEVLFQAICEYLHENKLPSYPLKGFWGAAVVLLTQSRHSEQIRGTLSARRDFSLPSCCSAWRSMIPPHQQVTKGRENASQLKGCKESADIWKTATKVDFQALYLWWRNLCGVFQVQVHPSASANKVYLDSGLDEKQI